MDLALEDRLSLISLLKLTLGSLRFKLFLIVSIGGYWILYSISAGMFFYYGFDLGPLLKSSPVPNPYFFVHPQDITNLYNSGMVWYPTNHLQVNLLFGPSFFSLILSILFGLNMLLFGYGISMRATARSLSLNSLGFVPALFSGGCCAVPFGTVLLTSFVPAATVSTFVYGYVALTNSLFAILMLFALLYSARKVGRCCNPR